MVTTEVELIPFTVPVVVYQKLPPRPKQAGITFAPSFTLSELSDKTLAALCEEFRNEVFRRAKEERNCCDLEGFCVPESTCTIED